MHEPLAHITPAARTQISARRPRRCGLVKAAWALVSFCGTAMLCTAAGCQTSPRDEYFQNRAIEHHGTAGDGTTYSLAPRLGETALAGASSDQARAEGIDDVIVR